MNIFVLSHSPFEAAQMHCDAHICQMITEYTHLLSIAHRILDGAQVLVKKPNGRGHRFYVLPGEQLLADSSSKYGHAILNPKCHMLSHANHPCAVWARSTDANYFWLETLFMGCLLEYTKRYGKTHACAKLLPFFSWAPKNIPRAPMTPFAQTMPDEYKDANAVCAYHNFYVHEKARFARWTNTRAPSWFSSQIKDYCAANFERTNSIHARQGANS